MQKENELNIKYMESERERGGRRVMFVKVAGMEGGGEVMSERHKRRMRRVERERERERELCFWPL